VTPEARVKAIEALEVPDSASTSGIAVFTPRQAAFLVLVMVHSGVCLRRQYARFAGMVYGQATKDFFKRLLRTNLASGYAAADTRARVYHVRAKSMYQAIGEPDNRNRKPITLARAVERLMILDTVLADRTLQWLGTESEKVDYFARTTQLRPSELPRLKFGDASDETVRRFPYKLPIGINGDGRTHVFLYLVTRKSPVDFRTFLQRHAELFRALPEWELRILVPRHFNRTGAVFGGAAMEELARPLGLGARDELSWYFRERQRLESGGAVEDVARFDECVAAFRAPRFRALYRLWKKEGDGLVHATVSRILGDSIQRRRGRVVIHVLPHLYQHLSPVVGTA
jgi:hypothetical protein